MPTFDPNKTYIASVFDGILLKLRRDLLEYPDIAVNVGISEGDPNGVVEGWPGDVRIDLDTPTIWQKQTGEGDAFGWTEVGGGLGPSVAALLNAPFVTFAADPTLTNERVVTAGTNVSIDLTTPGQIIINAMGGGGGADLQTAITNQGAVPTTQAFSTRIQIGDTSSWQFEDQVGNDVLVVAGDNSANAITITGGNTAAGAGQAIVATGGTATVAAQNGGGITLTGGTGNTTGTGGAFIAIAGTGGATGAGGAMSLSGGPGGATSGAGGSVVVQGGLPTDGNGGQAVLNGRNGVGTNRSGGAVIITAGDATGSGLGGSVGITAGDGGTTGTAGPLAITGGGAGTVSGASGDISIATQASTDGDTGSIALTTGNAAGAARAAGDVVLTAGSGTGTNGRAIVQPVWAGDGQALAIVGNGANSSQIGFHAGSRAAGPNGVVSGSPGSYYGWNRSGAVLAGGAWINTSTTDPGTTWEQIVTSGAGGGVTLQAAIDNQGVVATTQAFNTTIGLTGGASWFWQNNVAATMVAISDQQIVGIQLNGRATAAGAGQAIQILGGTATVAASAGGGVTVTGGTGNTSGTGGAIAIAAGPGGATGAGGTISLSGGAGGATSGNGGATTVQGGLPVDGNGGGVAITGRAGVGTSRTGGSVAITAGASTDAIAGGGITATSGQGGATGNGGVLTLTAGAGGATSGTGGTAALAGGAGTGTGANGGIVVVQGGTATDGNGGAATIQGRNGAGTDRSGGAMTAAGGTATGTGSGGNVSIFAGGGGVTGTPGAVTITGGAGGSTSGTAGAVTVQGGLPTDGNGGAVTISGRNGVGTNRNGGQANVTAGNATGSGSGGDLIMNAGSGGVSGSSGTVNIVGGAGGSTSGTGGAVNIQGGSPTNGNGGAVTIQGRNAVGTNRSGGNASITGGIATGTGTGGNITSTAGRGGVTGTAGTITIAGGDGGTTSGDGGAVTIQGGLPTDGNGGSVTITGRNGVGTNRSGGNVTLTSGSSTGSGTNGRVLVQPVWIGDGEALAIVGNGANAATSGLHAGSRDPNGAVTGHRGALYMRNPGGVATGAAYVNVSITDTGTIWQQIVTSGAGGGVTLQAAIDGQSTTPTNQTFDTSVFLSSGAAWAWFNNAGLPLLLMEDDAAIGIAITGQDTAAGAGQDVNVFGGAATTAGQDGGDVLVAAGAGSGAGLPGMVRINSAWALDSTISPAALASGNNNNYTPTNGTTTNTWRLTPNAAGSIITGITSGQAGRKIELFNLSTTNVIVLSHNDTGNSTAANCFFLPNAASLTIPPLGSATIWYDTVSSRWRTDAYSFGNVTLQGAINGQSTTPTTQTFDTSVFISSGAAWAWFNNAGLPLLLVEDDAAVGIAITGQDTTAGAGQDVDVFGGASTTAGQAGGDVILAGGGISTPGDLFGMVRINSAWALDSTISPSALGAGNTNNYSPTNGPQTNTWRLTPNAAGSAITGITNGQAGRKIELFNISTTASITLTHDDTGNSTAANCFLLPNAVSVVIPPLASISIWYDTTSSRWRPDGAAGAALSPGVSQIQDFTNTAGGNFDVAAAIAAGYTLVDADVIAAGGGGGGGPALNGTASQVVGGSGGGGGARRVTRFVLADLLATYGSPIAITVGAGGAGGAGGTNNAGAVRGTDGSPGGNSSFGVALVSGGGGGGYSGFTDAGSGGAGGGAIAGGTGVAAAGSVGGFPGVHVTADPAGFTGQSGSGGGGSPNNATQPGPTEYGGAPGAGRTAAGAFQQGTSSWWGGGGGGQGGGHSAGLVAQQPTAGGSQRTTVPGSGAAAGITQAAPTQGADGTNGDFTAPGQAGGGGGAALVAGTAGARGGDAGLYGNGGGGGGVANGTAGTPQTGGRGGNGAQGAVRLILT